MTKKKWNKSKKSKTVLIDDFYRSNPQKGGEQIDYPK